MRGRPCNLLITLDDLQAHTLRAWQRQTTMHAGVQRRGRIVLLRAAGHSITAIAQAVHMSRVHVYKWLWRFQRQGLAGLQPRPGRRGRKEEKGV